MMPGAAFEQARDAFPANPVGRPDRRRPTYHARFMRIAMPMGIASSIEQRTHYLDPCVRCGKVQGRYIDPGRTSVRTGAAIEKQPHRLRVTA